MKPRSAPRATSHRIRLQPKRQRNHADRPARHPPRSEAKKTHDRSDPTYPSDRPAKPEGRTRQPELPVHKRLCQSSQKNRPEPNVAWSTTCSRPKASHRPAWGKRGTSAARVPPQVPNKRIPKPPRGAPQSAAHQRCPNLPRIKPTI